MFYQFLLIIFKATERALTQHGLSKTKFSFKETLMENKIQRDADEVQMNDVCLALEMTWGWYVGRTRCCQTELTSQAICMLRCTWSRHEPRLVATDQLKLCLNAANWALPLFTPGVMEFMVNT